MSMAWVGARRLAWRAGVAVHGRTAWRWAATTAGDALSSALAAGRITADVATPLPSLHGLGLQGIRPASVVQRRHVRRLVDAGRWHEALSEALTAQAMQADLEVDTMIDILKLSMSQPSHPGDRADIDLLSQYILYGPATPSPPASTPAGRKRPRSEGSGVVTGLTPDQMDVMLQALTHQHFCHRALTLLEHGMLNGWRPNESSMAAACTASAQALDDTPSTTESDRLDAFTQALSLMAACGVAMTAPIAVGLLSILLRHQPPATPASTVPITTLHTAFEFAAKLDEGVLSDGVVLGHLWLKCDVWGRTDLADRLVAILKQRKATIPAGVFNQLLALDGERSYAAVEKRLALGRDLGVVADVTTLNTAMASWLKLQYRGAVADASGGDGVAASHLHRMTKALGVVPDNRTWGALAHAAASRNEGGRRAVELAGVLQLWAGSQGAGAKAVADWADVASVVGWAVASGVKVPKWLKALAAQAAAA